MIEIDDLKKLCGNTWTGLFSSVWGKSTLDAPYAVSTATEPKWVEGRVIPDDLVVNVGKLEITTKTSSDGFFAGHGTEIKYDGKLIKGVKSLTLRIAVDEVVTMTVEQLVEG